MFNSKQKNSNKVAIFTIAILLVLATLINVTLAYFTDSASSQSNSGEISFGTIAVKVSVADEVYKVENGQVKFTLSADEVTQSQVYRTIVLENVDGKTTEDFAIRIKPGSNSTKVTAGLSPTETDYIDSADLVSSNWLTGSDGKSYFKKFIHLPTGKKVYIPVIVEMTDDFSTADFSSAVYVTFDIEIIQSANDGYKSWTERPSSLNITETYTPPNEYTKLAYIQATGTQYIDTGFVATGGMTAEYKAMYLDDDGGYLVGSHSASSPYGRNGGFWGKVRQWELGYGEIYLRGGSGSANIVYTVEFSTLYSDAYLDVNGSRIVSSSGQNVSSTNVYIFTNYSDVTDGRHGARAKMYYAKIWDSSGALVRNFIPCKNSSGTIGLYDTVTKTFYTNAGTGTFVAGEEIGSYTQLAYIQATGTQYIDTGLIQSVKATVECKFEQINVSNNYLFGATQNSGAMMYNGFYSNSVLEYNWLTISYTASNIVEMKQRISGSNTIISINGTTTTVATGTDAGSGNVYIFACNSGNRKYTGVKCYYFKMYENNVLVRNFIPCKNSSGTIGLYDTVTKTFYTNAGTGTFVAG